MSTSARNSIDDCSGSSGTIPFFHFSLFCGARTFVVNFVDRCCPISRTKLKVVLRVVEEKVQDGSRSDTLVLI